MAADAGSELERRARWRGAFGRSDAARTSVQVLRDSRAQPRKIIDRHFGRPGGVGDRRAVPAIFEPPAHEPREPVARNEIAALQPGGLEDDLPAERLAGKIEG